MTRLFATLLCFSILGIAQQKPSIAPAHPVTDEYFGTRVADPYRYMENIDDPGTQRWMKEQNAYTRSVLARIPGRAQLLARIRELDQSVPQVEAWRLPGDIYFLLKALPGESTAKLYIRQDLNGEDRLVVDPQRIKLNPEDQGKGTTVIEWFAVSNNQKKVAVLVIPGGDELHGELHVLDIESGRESGEVLTQVGAEAPQVYWLPDDRSFVYGRLQKLPPGAPAAEVRQKYRSYLHVLGNSPEQDQPIFGYGVVPGIDVDPSLIASVVIQHGSHWALGVLNGSTTPNSAYYIEPLSDLGKNHSWRKIADFADGVTDVQLRDDNLYLLTYKNAPRYKVLRTDARHPDLASAETVVPTGDSVVATINSAQDALYVQFQDGAITRVSRLPYGDGAKMRDLELPVAGSAFLNTDPLVPGALFAVSSWTSAVKIYAYNPATGQLADTHLQPSGPYDNPGHIESKEVKARSYDGTLVPLSIIYPKDLKLDGSNPTLLEGYGAYGVSYTPYFRPTRSAWYEQGGVYAVCHVRGGGEYGEEWHLAGKIAKKPNTWRDFIACAQYLIQQKYTSSARLAGEGGSAGGILIGRAITSNPEIFAAAIDVVGMSDALRSELTQNGETNIPEFGSVQTREGFNALYTMSPYHHVVDKTPYPAVLLETGINDPRVDPWQMAKMAARLQAATSSGKPILLRIDYAGGHSSLNATAEQIEEQRADEFSFLLWTFGIPGFRTTPDLVKPQ